ncbi:hypothetical protein [Massilia sp. PWRC2]|uniref:hypothetical protein n=1 Tax=Massilia sp. PWRC2 TaxID=2804626 RepID=UPI003CF86687
MSPVDVNQTETIIRFSRRQLWGVLIIMIALTINYSVRMFHPDYEHAVGVLYVVFIVVFIVVFGGASSRIKWGAQETKQAISVLENDELRKFACAKAFRNGFFIQLLYPAACAFALLALGIADPWPLVVGSSTWLGFVTFIASVLWYDR